MIEGRSPLAPLGLFQLLPKIEDGIWQRLVIDFVERGPERCCPLGTAMIIVLSCSDLRSPASSKNIAKRKGAGRYPSPDQSSTSTVSMRRDGHEPPA
jgi:hypothetical protein